MIAGGIASHPVYLILIQKIKIKHDKQLFLLPSSSYLYKFG